MYNEGEIYDLEQRLHQLPANTGDLQLFYEEISSIGEVDGLSLKWEKELEKKKWQFDWTPTGV